MQRTMIIKFKYLNMPDKNSPQNKADKNFIGSIDTTFDHQAIKKYLLRPGRALINPFDPSQTTVR